MLTSLSFLQEGKPFPPKSEWERLEKYKNNRMLFDDEHSEVYKESFRRIQRVIGNFEDVISYEVIFNFQKLMSLKIADFICGSPPRISAADEEKQRLIDRIVIDTDLMNKLYMSVIDISRYGDSILQVSKDRNGNAKIDITSPKYWFPVVNSNNIKEFAYHTFAWRYIIDAENKKYGLAVQIHDPENPEVCEYHKYELKGTKGSFMIGGELTGKKEDIEIETKLDVCPVFVVSNVPTSDKPFGIDDYASIDSIVSELCVRVSQISKVLDKFSSPSMTGPVSMVEWDEAAGGYKMRYGNFYPVNDGEQKPEMIVWDAGLDANFKMIELLINQLYTISEMGSAVFGDISHSTGNVASGTALKRLMISPLAKARRIAGHYDRVLKHIISLCAKIYGVILEPHEISIQWNDGLPGDPVEEANIINLRTGGKATMSRYTAIRRFDKLSDADTDTELASIEQDEASSSMGVVPVNDPESVIV